MAMLVVSAPTDFRNQFFPELLTGIDFTNGIGSLPDEPFQFYTYASATFGPTQVDGNPLVTNLHVNGSSGHNEIKVIGGNADLSGWTFSNWSPVVQDFGMGGGEIFSDSIIIEGGAFADTLIGTTQRDNLNGLGGADSMAGGAGDDLYHVNHAGDVVSEAGGSGHDFVFSNVSFTLPDGVEDLSLIGSSGAIVLDGFGNGLDNTIFGSFLADNLKGFAGADVLYGGSNIFNGIEVLDGGLGADVMQGGSGSTDYHVDNAGDVVQGETGGAGGAGTDTVYASRSYALLAEFENLRLVSLGNFSGAGNGANNEITGNAFANSLNGHGGDDKIAGGLGNDIINGGRGNFLDRIEGGAGLDTMTGGAGNDTFIFRAITDSGASAASRDVITDFSIIPGAQPISIDRIHLKLIDARAGTAGDQTFTWIGSAAFSAEGQVRAIQIGTNTVVQINTIGTSGVESSIKLTGFTASILGAEDFVL